MNVKVSIEFIRQPAWRVLAMSVEFWHITSLSYTFSCTGIKSKSFNLHNYIYNKTSILEKRKY